jgi:hypothetical protein
MSPLVRRPQELYRVYDELEYMSGAPGVEGGFNWCSQRWIGRGCDGKSKGLGFSDDGAAGNAVAGASAGVAPRA